MIITRRHDGLPATSQSPQKTEVLESRDLVKTYKQRRVVDHLSIDVKAGEVVGLLGPNGAGKTTAFLMIVGLVRPNSGRIFIGGEEITRLPMYRRARLGIGYLPQEPSVFRKLTVRQNVLSVLETLPISADDRSRRAEDILEEFGVRRVADSPGHSLSGGERRRVEIGRALALEPSFLLLDEPFAGIDPIAVADIQRVVAQLRDKGLGILITDHNVRDTLSITDRAYIISEGRLLDSGTPERLANSPLAREIYLGERFTL